MKKILILANNDVGLYKFRKELITELLNENYKVYISLPYGEYVDELVKLGCQFINTPIDRRGINPIKDFKLLLTYFCMYKKIKPNFILTYTIKPNIYGGIIARLTQNKYITNITGVGTAIEKKGFIRRLSMFLYKVSMKNASRIFFQNIENLQLFKTNQIGSNYNLIPGSGVNINEYSLLEYPNDDEINFLFIARIMKEKGIDQYLEAAEFMKKKHAKTKFHVLGFCEHDYEEILKDYHDRKIIVYHGMQKDIIQYLKISHCTVHPTFYPEGMSNVLLESAASGRPIITTDRPGTREIVEENINGFFVNQESSSHLIEVIEKFLELSHESKKEMGLKGREKVTREFDRNLIVNSYMEEINN